MGLKGSRETYTFFPSTPLIITHKWFATVNSASLEPIVKYLESIFNTHASCTLAGSITSSSWALWNIYTIDTGPFSWMPPSFLLEMFVHYLTASMTFSVLGIWNVPTRISSSWDSAPFLFLESGADRGSAHHAHTVGVSVVGGFSRRPLLPFTELYTLLSSRRKRDMVTKALQCVRVGRDITWQQNGCSILKTLMLAQHDGFHLWYQPPCRRGGRTSVNSRQA